MIGRLNYGVSDARLEEIVQEDMSRYRAMIGQPLPLFGSPFADAAGNVWLPSYRPAYPEEGSPYTVISSDGEWLGQVETPPRFRILDVTGGLVLGVLRDEMDVENVVVYELVGSGYRPVARSLYFAIRHGGMTAFSRTYRYRPPPSTLAPSGNGTSS